ncbi:hypothetical protein BGZ98_001724, partial [Dissophora globulifera]
MPIFTAQDTSKQSAEVPGTRTPGATGHYRQLGYMNGLVDHIREAPEIKTVHDLFLHAVAKFPNRDLLGHRPYNSVTKTYGGYVWQTYTQVIRRVDAFGSGVMHLNEVILGNTQLNRWSLGIWALGRPEWYISDMSCNMFNLMSVPLYDTLGPDAVEYVCNHAEIRVVVCTANHVATLLRNADRWPTVKAVISMDSLSEGSPVPGSTTAANILRSWGEERGIRVYDFDEIERLGQQFPRKYCPPQPEDIAALCYTSGTTGQPKGAMIHHGGMVAAVGAGREAMQMTDDDVLISYLPLAHMMGRIVDTSASFYGCKIGYFRGDLMLLMEDIAELKPTYFPTVPRLLNRIYANIVASTIEAPGFAGKMCRRAVAAKLANLKAGNGVTHPLWDRLVFNKVKMALGGRVQVILTGSAPIANEVMSFMRIAMCCVVTEGYGSTESLALGTLTFPNEHVPGHVGCPRSGIEMKLVDVPEMNYLSTDKPYPRGEIQFRGASIFTGYYKDEENTRNTIDSEGWLATGDIGIVDDRGCLTIVDRKKNIFKLAQGEYIAPEKIENILTARCNLILQIYVHGDSLESSLVAISVPDPEMFIPFANAIAGTQVTIADKKGLMALVRDPKVNAAYLKALEKAGKAGELRGFEFVKRVYLTFDAFTVDNGLMTPTSK